MIPDSSISGARISEARGLAEKELELHPDGDRELVRLDRLAGSLDGDGAKLVVYLRAANALQKSSSDEIFERYGEDVAEALEVFVPQEGDVFADLVMRAARNPMTYEILANEIGEELSHLAQARDSGAFTGEQENRWDLLILSQALMDRVSGEANAGGGDPEPVVIESGERSATVYLHPVHGDVVVLVRSPDGTEEDWVLINNQDAKRLLLELVADLLDKPLREGLVPWLEARGISHRVYAKEGDEGAGGVATS